MTTPDGAAPTATSRVPMEVLRAGETGAAGGGDGRDPVVFLHGDDGVVFSSAFIDALARHRRLLAPLLPGWGVTPRPAHVGSVEDLSYLCLDVLRQLTDRPVPVVGASVGAWLALEAAIKSTASISALMLVAPVGVKISGREERDFLDVYASRRDEVQHALYGSGPEPDLGPLGPEDFERLAWAQDAMARVAFKPYLHDPKLLRRLYRVDVPTLVVFGEEDGLVLDPRSYAEALAAALPDARVAGIPGCGHRVEEQAPERLAELLEDFLSSLHPAKAGAGVGPRGAGAVTEVAR